MGSSIRSYLWPCCGVFHQIPTLAEVLTSSGEGYKGSDALSPFVSVVDLLPCIFVLCRCRLSWERVFVYRLCACLIIQASVCLSVSTCVSSVMHMSRICILHLPLSGLYVHVHVLCDSVCACDRWRPCGQGSEGWPVDTEPWQGSFLLPSL